MDMEPEHTVRRRLQQLVLVGLLSMIYADAWADLRVLFRFDGSGHYVHSLTKAPQRVLLRKPAHDGVKIMSRQAGVFEPLSMSDRVTAASAELRPAMATLLWSDTNGGWLSNSEVPDPRVAHSPAHIDGVNESFVGLDSGAWLASGPDEATAVTILFPAHVGLALGTEQWHVALAKD